MVFMIGTPFTAGESNGLLTGLLHCYEMESDATDEHGSIDGTATNITRDTSIYHLGTASGDYNGSSSKISMGTSTDFDMNSADRTFLFWVRFDDVTVRSMVASKWSNGSRGFVFDTNSSKMRIVTGNGGGTTGQVVAADTTLSSDTWYQVGFTRDTSANTFTHILNGSTDGSSSSVTTTGDSTEDFALGETLGTIWIDGRIDQVAVWDRILTSDELTAHYNTGSGLVYSSWTT